MYRIKNTKCFDSVTPITAVKVFGKDKSLLNEMINTIGPIYNSKYR